MKEPLSGADAPARTDELSPKAEPPKAEPVSKPEPAPKPERAAKSEAAKADIGARPEPAKAEPVVRTDAPKAEKVDTPRVRPLGVRRLPRETLSFLEIVVHAIAWLGVILVVYGVVSTTTAEVWLPLERFILPIAATLVLAATILNALTIYIVPENPAPPSGVNRYVTAPTVIFLSAAALVLVWSQGLPVAVILGLAVLGLAWALFRVLPRPSTSSW